MAVALASGQTLAGRIVMPDSSGFFGIALRPASDTIHAKVYLGGIGAVGVLAGPEGRRSARIEVAGAGNHFFHGLILDESSRKLYSIPGYDTLITVIDTRTDSVVALMTGPNRYWVIFDGIECACLNTQNNKLYVWTTLGLARFDVSADTLLGWVEIPVGVSNPGMCHNPVNNKFYFIAWNNRVAIFDAEADTLLDTVPAGNGACQIAYLERCNKIYVTNLMGSNITVIDGAGDSVICHISTPGGPNRMIMNKTRGKVYVSCDPGFVVLDGFGDSVRTVIPAQGAAAHTWNPRTDKVYLSYDGGVLVADGSSDTVLADISVPIWVAGAVCNPDSNIIYFYDECTSQLLAIDGSADTIMWSEYTGRQPAKWRPTAWSSLHRKLYIRNPEQYDVISIGIDPYISPQSIPVPCTSRSSHCVALSPDQDKLYVSERRRPWTYIVSCSTETLIDSIRLTGRPYAYKAIEPFNRLYWAVSPQDTQFLDIVDTNTDSVISTIPCSFNGYASPWSFCAFSETSNKVYWPSGDSVLVIDVAGDSVLTVVSIGPRRWCNALCWQSIRDRVYVSTNEGFAVIDCATDSVVAEIPSQTVVLHTCYNPEDDRVYGVTELGYLAVIDCSQNRLVRLIPVGGDPQIAPVYNPKGNKVFIAAGGSVVAFDCLRGELVDPRIVTGYGVYSLNVDPDSGYIFAVCGNSAVYVIEDRIPGALESKPENPLNLMSLEVKPNPALGGVLISVYLPKQCRTKIAVYDTAGRLVQVLADDETGPGRLQVHWDGTSDETKVPAGTYFVKLETKAETLTKKVVLPR